MNSCARNDVFTSIKNITLAPNPISLINPGLKAGAIDIYSFQEK